MVIEIVQQYWKKQVESGSIVEVNGRLAQPNADGGSLASWGEAKAKLIEDGKDRKKLLFDVPVGETDRENHEITARYVENKGWRLDVDVTIIH